MRGKDRELSMDNQLMVPLLFERSRSGRRAARLPPPDTPLTPVDELLPGRMLSQSPPPLPELTEPEIVRHFIKLSQQNMSVDTHFYPLGSCTMKYNPKRNERLAVIPGMVDLHPYQPTSTVQGLLRLLFELQEILAEISGLSAVSLQPAAGAQGELTALMIAKAYFHDLHERRTLVLTPDSSHGTNPASAAMAGFDIITVKSTPNGLVNLEHLIDQLDQRVAVLMLTNPNTLGLFEPQIERITAEVHNRGGLIYLDGANMNAILGVVRPGDFGADMMHFNPHKTFSGPHGGGGPGAGPICVNARLKPYLPSPVVVQEKGRYEWHDMGKKSIGRVRSFYGNIGVLVRTYAYLLTHGPDGLQRVAENAVLNANYLLSRVRHLLEVPHGDRCMHEFVASAAKLKEKKQITATDLAKRLLDHGWHAPTVYFPLTVREAMMIEPTETESKENLDAFAESLTHIVQESPEFLRSSPHTTRVSRPDEVQAARDPVVVWTDESKNGLVG